MHIHGGMLSGNLAAGGSAAAEAERRAARAGKEARQRLLGAAAAEIAGADDLFGSSNPEIVGLVQAWSGGAGGSSPQGKERGVAVVGGEMQGRNGIIRGSDEEDAEPMKPSAPVSFWA
jgi:membrane protein involved in colicin uptake